MPFSGLVNLTLAWGTTAPVVSVTVPLSVAVVTASCACTLGTVHASAANNAVNAIQCSFRSLNAASKLSSFAFGPLLGGGKDEEIQSFMNRMALYGRADSIDKVFAANSTFLIL